MNHSTWWELFLQLEHGQPTASMSQGGTRVRSRLMTCCISIVAQGSHCRSHCLPVRPVAPAAPQLGAGMVTSRTRSPPHDAHRKPTSVMPRSPHRCGTVRGAKPAGEKRSPSTNDPRVPQQHDLTQLQGDLLDRGQVASKAPKEMFFKRRCACSGRSSVNTMPGHL